ncbi:MAG TPA: type II toxin-antitoxin system VapC family toxin [Frankiaceae bacterium]|nr:type II toxin-antitoxin system VapC family toxin [Frankiaceae bacterium]
MTAPSRGILDTSVFIADEAGRPLTERLLPDESAVSVVTLAELQAGVLAAGDSGSRAARLATLGVVADMALLPIDERVALAWARLRVQLAESGRRVNVNDSWIAATALAYDLPVVTQDADFDVLMDVAGLAVVRV